MSQIDEKIARLCPRGIPFKTLKELGTFLRGNGLQKKDFTDSGVGCIHYGQIHTHYGMSATKTITFVSPLLAKRLRHAQTCNLVIATTSEDDEAVAKAVAWLGAEDVAVSGDAYIYRHSLDPKYVAYFFESAQFSAQKRSSITGTKVRRISGESLAKIRIPVPPLEVQRDIVKVLDNFTELEAELKAELKARRSQYHYYRDALLEFAERATSASVGWTTLGEVCDVRRGRVISRDYLRAHPGSYPVYSSQTDNGGVFGFIDTFDCDSESITWTTDGANAGSVFYHRDEKFSITNVCGLLNVVDPHQVNTKFLYYLLGRVAKQHVNEGMGNPKLMSNTMSRIQVPVPSLKEQERIVTILDELDALVNDHSIGLPAELKARRQQYEYYRDRLLTFREAA